MSGAQTGVDRAALDAALAVGLDCGGWCPKGRRAEEGVIPARYPVREASSPRYEQRTEWNVRDSDGTLILSWGTLSGGTALTHKLACGMGRPVFLHDLAGGSEELDALRAWIDAKEIEALNVAGPRASHDPRIYGAARSIMDALLAEDP